MYSVALFCFVLFFTGVLSAQFHRTNPEWDTMPVWETLYPHAFYAARIHVPLYDWNPANPTARRGILSFIARRVGWSEELQTWLAQGAGHAPLALFDEKIPLVVNKTCQAYWIEMVPNLCALLEPWCSAEVICPLREVPSGMNFSRGTLLLPNSIWSAMYGARWVSVERRAATRIGNHFISTATKTKTTAIIPKHATELGNGGGWVLKWDHAGCSTEWVYAPDLPGKAILWCLPQDSDIQLAAAVSSIQRAQSLRAASLCKNGRNAAIPQEWLSGVGVRLGPSPDGPFYTVVPSQNMTWDASCDKNSLVNQSNLILFWSSRGHLEKQTARPLIHQENSYRFISSTANITTFRAIWILIIIVFTIPRFFFKDNAMEGMLSGVDMVRLFRTPALVDSVLLLLSLLGMIFHTALGGNALFAWMPVYGIVWYAQTWFLWAIASLWCWERIQQRFQNTPLYRYIIRRFKRLSEKNKKEDESTWVSASGSLALSMCIVTILIGTLAHSGLCWDMDDPYNRVYLTFLLLVYLAYMIYHASIYIVAFAAMRSKSSFSLVMWTFLILGFTTFHTWALSYWVVVPVLYDINSFYADADLAIVYWCSLLVFWIWTADSLARRHQQHVQRTM